MVIPLKQALELFKEANEFDAGNSVYISLDSEIRAIATKTFGYSTVTTIMAVTHEIFRVIAQHHVKECNDGKE